ncbi:DUF6708 domain-containing protein [Pseudomonas putida]|uniref:DUF6708 domain-containing protein n=1 Tax=Pseudomonas putida TaxID=303 RepID=UPI0021F8F90F|nr:DUF6708 domain-containing protein [Pseudomonas putida]
MAIMWFFDPQVKTDYVLAIKGQVASCSKDILVLRNPWVADSVFMAKLYTAMILILAVVTYSDVLSAQYRDVILSDAVSVGLYIFTPFIFSPFLVYRIFLIRNLSGIHLNRTAKKIYYQRINTLMVFDWNNIGGGLFKRTEFGGSSFSTSYALAFAPRRKDGSLHQKDCLWVDSNEPTEPGIKHVAEVWEYLRHFMDHGPDKLPPPGEPNWWYRPLHAICLTPVEAWRHYAPWRTGEPGEMQGKKNWQLPFWAVLFPYNFTLALCWFVVCRVFNVRAAPAPPEAFETAPAKPSKKKRK